MDKFLYIPDQHFGAQPVSRKDNYNNSIISKIRYVLTVAAKNGCTVLFGGDLFDSPKITMFVFIKLLHLFNEFKQLKIIAIRGNHSHDGFPELSPLTMLGIFMDNITIVDGIGHMELMSTNLIFRDNSKNPNHGNEDVVVGKTNILMTHHIITENPVIYKHFLMKDIDSAADVVLLADYHPCQGIKNVNGKIFVSPGALARRKNTAHDIGRIPKFAYIKTEIGKQPLITLKDIPCDLDVFVEKAQIEKEEVDVLTSVQQMVELMDSGINTANISDAIGIYADKMKTDKDVIDYIKLKLGI